jgi:hypothetical protein
MTGSIPLHTLEADVDYGFAPSFTTYGAIGVKVWIHRGMFGERPSEEDQAAAAAMTRARRRRERRTGGRGQQGEAAPRAGMRPGGSRLGGRRAVPAAAAPAEREQTASAGADSPSPQTDQGADGPAADNTGKQEPKS